MATSLTDRSSRDSDDDAPFDLDSAESLRPLAEPTWRERLDDATAGLRRTPLRSLVPVVGLIVLGLVAWWLLRPPAAPPIESVFPSASTDGSQAEPKDADPSPEADATGEDTEEPPDGSDSEPEELVIAVAGAVNDPGVHRVDAGSRVDDALRVAGGPLPEADLDRLNLAAPLADGERVWVPVEGETDPPEVIAGSAPPTDGTSGDDDGEGAAPVNLNTATAAELEELSGVGPATADAIIEHREQNGDFADVDELIDVSGIGEVKLEQIRPDAVV